MAGKQKRPGARGKTHLPEKSCARCGRPFKWRRKWADVWDDVRYCSDRCKRSRD
ncbi:DUF2256 domain-containing protein [Henriciella litoralis]|uniref:DUF2256 domain-containing protein n=1 Tax=Henriciella litoralis TaxID=568102 RepID=UPI000A00C2D4|nr:DUF2256 domain-containing protein [Henriciella litoralis]